MCFEHSCTSVYGSYISIVNFVDKDSSFKGTLVCCPKEQKCCFELQLYCLSGCPAGTYQDDEGQDDCKPCPTGYYCYANSTTYIGNECPRGHYCLEGTSSPHHYPCNPGRYNPKPRGNSSADCLPCDPGHYCAGFGNEKPTNSCTAGFFCPGENRVAQPSASRCTPGHFCPQGSYNMTKCLPGWYCDVEGLHEPVAQCDKGYYCPLGSFSRQQEECPAGHYCPLGSPVPSPCQPGSYLPGSRHENVSECLPCIAGWYCNSSGMNVPDGQCDQRYYCPPGQSVSSPNAYPCPVGHFCEKGSPEPERCPNGTYQDQRYSYECKQCLAGYYCDNTVTGVSSLAGFECPIGHYCPAGTSFATEYKCPPGTWSNKTQLVKPSECTDCPPR